MVSDELHWFITLAELEHVGAAADRLRLSQPTLSRMLARLERRLGVRLFDRRGKRLVLNDFGRIYYEHARRARAELEAAGRALADLANPELGLVRLSFLHSLGARLVPGLIADFRRTSGRVTFTLDQDGAEAVTGRVREGSADLGIVSPRPADPGLGWRRLLRQRLALAVPADHRLAGLRQIRLAEATTAEFVTTHPGYGTRRILDELSAAAGIRPRIAFECSDLITVTGLVAAGLGVALVPLEDTPRGRGPADPVLIPLADPGAMRSVGLIWSAEAVPSEVVVAFREFAAGWADRAGAAAAATGS